jgi:uncharacterized membrane protein YdjX (TVP38/TMEM64 family)
VIEQQKKRSVTLSAALWLFFALAASGAVYWLISQGVLSWSAAVAAHGALVEGVLRHPLLAIAAYIALFIMAALLLFPAQLWIIVLGGVLFGFERAFAASWAAAIVSAGLVFLIGRSTIGEIYRRHARGYLDRVGGAFQKDQFFYMLTLRFIPVCPFCVANIVPALLGARLAPFLAATAIGVAPYVAAYCFAGARAATMLDPSRPPDIARLSGDIALVLFALACMPAIAVIVRAQARRKRPSDVGAPS